jgi:hypothetical protein
VTKWDIFEDTDDSVANVRKMILSLPRIQKYVRTVHDDSEIKIIPVSAVGKGFARWNPEKGGHGEMEIISSQPDEPINVTMPIAMLVPGLMRRELRRIERENNIRGQSIMKEPIPWWKRLLGGTGDFLAQSATLRRIASEFGIDPTDVDRVAMQLKDPLIKTHDERQRRIGELAANVRTEKEASAIAQSYFENLCAAFDEKYPSASIKG